MTTTDLITIVARIAVDRDIESLRKSAFSLLEELAATRGRLDGALAALAIDAEELRTCEVPPSSRMHPKGKPSDKMIAAAFDSETL